MNEFEVKFVWRGNINAPQTTKSFSFSSLFFLFQKLENIFFFFSSLKIYLYWLAHLIITRWQKKIDRLEKVKVFYAGGHDEHAIAHLFATETD